MIVRLLRKVLRKRLRDVEIERELWFNCFAWHWVKDAICSNYAACAFYTLAQRNESNSLVY